jgi:hypothetical protein
MSPPGQGPTIGLDCPAVEIYVRSSPDSLGRMVAKADQPGFVRVQAEIEQAHPFLQLLQKFSRLMLMLEANERIIRIADYDHVTGGLGAPPAMDPQIVHVVQVDVSRSLRVTRPSSTTPAGAL